MLPSISNCCRFSLIMLILVTSKLSTYSLAFSCFHLILLGFASVYALVLPVCSSVGFGGAVDTTVSKDMAQCTSVMIGLNGSILKLIMFVKAAWVTRA